MPNEIYHRSNWGNANAEGFGDVYFDAAATNKLYNHSDYYENSDGTDKILRDIPNKASIVLTPTAYSDGSLNTVIPPYQVLPTELVTNGDFSDGTNDWIASNSTLSLDNGYLKITSTGGNRPQAYQTVLGLIAGKKYRLSAEAKRGTCVNEVEIEISGIGSTVDTNKNNTTEFKNIFYEFTATSTTHIIQAKIDDGASTVGETAFFKIVNLKEIQEADFDFSRGSSATRVNEKGLIEDVASGIPRIDYTTGFGSLLLEPQRTNYVTYSEDLSQWSTNDVTLESGYTAPDGSTNAYKVTKTGNNAYVVLSGVAANDNARTIYARTVSGSGDVKLTSHNFNTNNLFTVTEEWQRFEVNSAPQIGTNFYAVDFRGAGSTLTEVIIWGAQTEIGDYATSYIVSNSGSATTRSAETANNSGNADLFNDSEGVLYAEVAALADDATFKSITINDGSTSNRILLSLNGDDVYYGVASGGTFQAFDDVSINSITNLNKLAVKYKLNDFALWINGFEVLVDASGGIPSGLSQINFDKSDGTDSFYGKAKELAVFKEALTDAELESLTSWISFTEMATDLEYTLE